MIKKTKTLFMETTNIEAGQTVGEIQRILGKYGATAVLTEYEEGEVSALSFKVRLNDADNEIEVPFRLPCRWEHIQEILVSRRKRKPYKRNDSAQAKRVAWRQILRWIEAQLALVDTGMVEIMEVFLPYMQDGKGNTIYDKMLEGKFKLLEYK